MEMIDKQNRMLAVMRSETDHVLEGAKKLESMFGLLLKKLPATTYHEYLKELELTGFTREYVGYHTAEYEDRWRDGDFRRKMHDDMMQAITSPTRIRLSDIT